MIASEGETPVANWRITDEWHVVDLAPGVHVQVSEGGEGVWHLWVTAGGTFTVRFARVPTLTAAKRAALEGVRSSFPTLVAVIDELLAQLPEE